MVTRDRSSEVLSDASLFIPLARLGAASLLTGEKRIRFASSPINVVIYAVDDDNPPWLEPVVSSIVQLLHLEQNWDTYGSPEIDPEKAIFGLKVLLSNLDRNAPTPAVVPTSSGGLQFEWHIGGIDLEIEVVSAGRVDVLYENQRQGIENELTYTSNFIPLAEILRELPPNQT